MVLNRVSIASLGSMPFAVGGEPSPIVLHGGVDQFLRGQRLSSLHSPDKRVGRSWVNNFGGWDYLLEASALRTFATFGEARAFVYGQGLDQVEYGITETGLGAYKVYRSRTAGEVNFPQTERLRLHTHVLTHAVPSLGDLNYLLQQEQGFWTWIYARPPSGEELALVQKVALQEAVVWHSRQNASVRRFSLTLDRTSGHTQLREVELSASGEQLNKGCYDSSVHTPELNEKSFWEGLMLAV